MSAAKIIVLTPVKNEEWILEKFLRVTSTFADHIIILDQNSSDKSRSIAQGFAKVILLSNESEKYDEAFRQKLLIKKAREISPDEKRILLALDADEILAADYASKPSWEQMKNAAEGTVLCFNKVDIYKSPLKYLDYENPWPLGYVDEGVEHEAKLVHSIRIPTPASAPKLVVNDVYILHYAMVDFERQKSKMRMYSVIEKIAQTKNFYNRRMAYKSNKDWKGKLCERDVPTTWIESWEKSGINLHHFDGLGLYWQDEKVLEYFEKYGVNAFYSEDIWDIDWKKISARYGKEKRIKPPTLFRQYYYNIVYFANHAMRKIYRGIKN